MPKRIKNPTVLALLFLPFTSFLFTSCKTYSNYQAQEINTDSIVRAELIQADSSMAAAGWREVFADPQLAALIEEGLANNSDLRIAKLHIDAAKAELRQAKGSLFPEVGIGAEGEVKRLRSSANKDDDDDSAESGFTKQEDEFAFGPEISWEIDIFGKMRNARKAAAATVEEKQWYAQAVQVELIATIATSYYQLEMFDAQIADTRSILESWEESIRAQKALMDVGEATSDEVAQAEAGRFEAEEKLEELQMQVLQGEHALCAVLGRFSGHVARSDFQTSVGRLNVVDGLPLQALANRPDVRQAEAVLMRAYYLTNEARAAFYPSLTIGGQVGFGYGADNDGTLTGLLTRVFGSLTMPVFAQGRLKADLEKAKAEQEEAQIAFRQALLDASKEVNDILAGQHKARRTIALKERQLEKLNHVLQVTETRMKYESEVSFLQVLLARQSLLEARLSLLDNRYALVESVINLYRALGGSSTCR